MLFVVKLYQINTQPPFLNVNKNAKRHDNVKLKKKNQRMQGRVKILYILLYIMFKIIRRDKNETNYELL